MRAKLVWSLALLILSGHALAGDYGKVTWFDQSATMTDACAFVRPSGDGTEQIIDVVLSAKPLKKLDWNAAEYDRRNEYFAQTAIADGDPLSVVLEIDAQGKLERVAVFAGSSTIRNGGEHNLRLSRRDVNRVEGTVGTPNVEKAGGINLDLTFALDIQGIPDFGPALPADGGAPFKAYQAYVAAVQSGKPEAIAKAMTQVDAEDLLGVNKRYNDPHAMDRKIKGMQMHTLHDVKFVSGNSKGDDARVVVSGILVSQSSGNKKATREPAQELVKLLRENGQWHVSAD